MFFPFLSSQFSVHCCIHWLEGITDSDYILNYTVIRIHLNTDIHCFTFFSPHFLQSPCRQRKILIIMKNVQQNQYTEDLINMRQNFIYYEIFLNQFSFDCILRFVTGYFQVCIDNTPYRFSAKLVYIYIVTYIMEEWAQYVEEIQSISLTAQNFSVNITSLMNN